MLKTLKQVSKIFLIVFLFIVLIIAILSVWDFVDKEIVKEMFLKTFYTVGALYILSLLIILITNKTENK
ncbi:MAG: hypothetical protein V1910_02735 [bacterium]